MPDLLWDALKSLLKSIWLILLPNSNGSNIVNLSDEDKLYPAFVLAISELLLVLNFTRK